MKRVIIVLLIVNLMNQCRPDRRQEIDLDFSPDKVELFAEGIISTRLYERDIAISPDKDEIIYTLSDYRQLKRCLVSNKRKGNQWENGRILGFSGTYNDIEPFISPEGDKLYFASDRPIFNDSARNDFNIWVSEKNKDGWSEPQPLDAIINTERDEFYPSLAKNGNLYFTSVRENGQGSEDIFVSRLVNGTYTAPEPLDTAVNSPTYEFNAYISPDEDLIIFSSYGRKDDSGGGDLYYSRKNKDGKWEKAVNMGSGINSDKLDYCPFLDVSTGNFYFTSDRVISSGKKINTVSELDSFANGVFNGTGNIFRIRMQF